MKLGGDCTRCARSNSDHVWSQTRLRSARAKTDRTAHARAAETAVAAWFLAQVLLVIILGVVELRRVDDLGRDLTVARRLQALLIHRLRRLGRGLLLGRERVDARPVLRTHVV